MTKKTIATTSAPKAIGPYSQANVIECKKLVFVSGQVPIDRSTGKIMVDDITGQTRQVCENLGAILNAAGSALENVVRTTCYLKSMDDFKAFNEVYQSYFKDDFPARSTVQVARLPLDALVEIDAIAYID